MNTTSLPTSYSLEAEQAVLGGLLANNEKWEEVSEIVNEHNFYVSAHKVIFNTIVKNHLNYEIKRTNDFAGNLWKSWEVVG